MGQHCSKLGQVASDDRKKFSCYYYHLAQTFRSPLYAQCPAWWTQQQCADLPGSPAARLRIGAALAHFQTPRVPTWLGRAHGMGNELMRRIPWAFGRQHRFLPRLNFLACVWYA